MATRRRQSECLSALLLSSHGKRMLQNSQYSVWFRTPQGEGYGIISLIDGILSGGDNISSYAGNGQRYSGCRLTPLAVKRAKSSIKPRRAVMFRLSKTGGRFPTVRSSSRCAACRPRVMPLLVVINPSIDFRGRDVAPVWAGQDSRTGCDLLSFRKASPS